MSEGTYIYVTYIATTPQKLWRAITEGEFTQKYFFGRRIQSDFAEGSPVEFYRPNGELDVFGVVTELIPERLLSYTWNVPGDANHQTQVSFEVQALDEGTVKLTLKHEDLRPEDWVPDNQGFYGYNNGWPAILSNLKTFLETGNTLIPIVAD